jgi:hypothetical protein
MRADDYGLAGLEFERGVVKVEREQHRTRRDLRNVNERQSDDPGHVRRVYLSPCMSRARRLRGLLIRLVLNRPVAIGVGAVLAAPGVLLMLRDYEWESGATDGLGLLLVATGIAIVWAGITGRRADWVE